MARKMKLKCIINVDDYKLTLVVFFSKHLMKLWDWLRTNAKLLLKQIPYHSTPKPFVGSIPIRYGDTILNHRIIQNLGQKKAIIEQKQTVFKLYSFSLNALLLFGHQPSYELYATQRCHAALSKLCDEAKKVGATHVVNVNLIYADYNSHIGFRRQLDVIAYGDAVIAIPIDQPKSLNCEKIDKQINN
jgi:uncharacterized protein YbjQ (UPF0145 family)